MIFSLLFFDSGISGYLQFFAAHPVYDEEESNIHDNVKGILNEVSVLVPEDSCKGDYN